MLKANYWKKVLLIVLLVSIVSNLAGAETFRFTVSCDNRPLESQNIPRWEWLLDEMSGKVIDEGVFHIIPGDFDDPEYTDASLRLQFGEDVVWYPVVGNHESETPADMEWIRNAYYSLPHIVKEGPAGCETTTYSWDYGNAHFVALNEYYNGVSDTGTGGDVVDELYDWLVADLEANTKPFVFIIGHEPAYPEYRHVGDSLDQYPAHRDRFWKLLNDEQVTAYFCGHTHYYYAKQVDGPDWEPFTWQVDTGNAGNPGEAYQTFVDVTVTETAVIFNTWQGTQNSPFTNIESWTIGIPYKAYRPKPADGAVHSETWATLSWTAGAGAVSHDVYFGENFDDVNDGAAGTFRGNQTETSFAVGSPESAYPQGLAPGVTYYWRVNEVNDLDPNSPWKGNVWSFMTAPGYAMQPDPANNAVGVALYATLSWWPGLTAATHDVYFGTNSPPPFIGNQTEPNFNPGPLEPGATYYWQIAEIEADGTTIYTGDIWSFTTVPGYATQPDPANDGLVVALDATLSWLPGPTAATHDVYFGTSSPPPFIGNQEESGFDPNGLEPKTTYYWQIDEIEADGTTIYTGDIWSFKTPRPGTGTILLEIWGDLGIGTSVLGLTGNENYPHSPMFSIEVMLFEAPTDIGDAFGSRLHGYLHPETSGDYLFWIASDDNGELWLSTDESPANAVLISTVSDWAGPRQFDDPDVVPSGPIHLEGGQKYYIMALYKEGGGNDNLAVAWEGPDSPTREVIHGYYLSPFVQLAAYSPDPADGTIDVKRTPILSWSAGNNTASVNGHELYLSSDVNAVNNRIADKVVLSEPSYSVTTKLDLGKTYYWCVDEVEADGITRHSGDVWSFTVTTVPGRP